ncbi:MAG: family 14 glycosylhydrolase [Candidatus Hydrogenedentes bacterium]|nr:family 14 glycosylhydrolase [Candidatus Hydrogenedentota bacterium]
MASKRTRNSIFLFACVLLCFTVCGDDAFPAASFSAGGDSSGLSPLSGSDGIFEVTRRAGRACLFNKPGQQPPSTFLYFSAAPERLPEPGKAVYVEVTYFDNKPGTSLRLEYDSNTGNAIEDMYRAAEQQWGGSRYGASEWKRVVFLLEQPGFTGRQNLGASFRIGTGDLLVQTVSLSPARPSGLERLDAPQRMRRVSKTHIGADRHFIIGGFDIDKEEALDRQLRELRGALPALKAMGLTSHEAYVRWNLCEPEPDRYDWRLYDAYVEVYRQAGVKWVPFLIIGSAYSLPDWYYKQTGSQGYICLEHGETCDVESLWNPVLRGHVANFIQAFCEHYRDENIIESILLGITGNYGEAIYVASGNDWTANTHGEYHTHPGIWAGDPHAQADFRRFLSEKYSDIARLNLAWNSSFETVEGIEPFLRENAPNDRAWLDFAAWYIGSMNDYTRFWVETTRAYFPGRIEICTGGHAPVEHGANFGDQCKIAAEYGAGVRITNEASDYRKNFSLTRWVASAGRQYGAYYSFEPAGPVDENGIVARVYNATASDALGLHYYYPNLFGSDRARRNFVRWAPLFRHRKPIVEVAAYYPQTHIILNGNEFLKRVEPLRDYFDFAYCSDNQIADGGLEQFKALLLLWGNTAEQETWDRISEWVRRGGLLVTADSIGPLRTVEGDTVPNDALLGPGADTGKGRVMCFSGPYDDLQYRRFMAKSLSEAPELSKITRYMAGVDGREDNVFATATGPQELLWLSMNNQKVSHGETTLCPYTITEEKVLTGRKRRHGGK